MKDLSVVILTWNTAALVRACILGIRRELADLQAKYGVTSEIWVVDNGSTDGTAERWAGEPKGIEWLVLEENLGFAAGNNAAFARCQGRALLLLNSDAAISSDGIASCLEVLHSSREVGAVGPRLVGPDGRTQASVHGFPGVLDELVPRRLREVRARRVRLGGFEAIRVDALRGAVFFVKREVLDRIGPLNDDYFFFLEETEWCWRMREAQFDVFYLPDVMALHVGGASSKAVSPVRTRIEFHAALYRFVEARQGRIAAGVVRGIRLLRAVGTALLAAPTALFRDTSRQRLRERLALVSWHLRGRPEGEGLAPPGRGAKRHGGLDGHGEKGEASAEAAQPRPTGVES